MKKLLVVCLGLVFAVSCSSVPKINTVRMPDDVRAEQVKDLEFGMFICWSFSTFSGYEWTRDAKGVNDFKATGCDTDQWCETAKKAGMKHILFLAKHHDGFCLWDTKTTDWTVMNAPLGRDVLAELRKSCDKYGIKLALYFSEGDWTWLDPNDPLKEKDPRKYWSGSNKPEVMKAQLKELCTQYGPIEFYWMDHAQGTGGMTHQEIVDWVHKFQPNCFVGFNHGEHAGRIKAGEMARPGKPQHGYLVHEFTYPILPGHQGGANWFYSLPRHDHLCHTPEKIYRDYLGAVKYRNVFSLDIGPNYEGRIRDIDVKTLTAVGRMIKEKPDVTFGLKSNYIKPVKVIASSIWSAEYNADKAADGDESTRWGAKNGSRSGWLELDLGKQYKIDQVGIVERSFQRTEKFVVEYKDGSSWKKLHEGTTIGEMKVCKFKAVNARYVRLNILKANEVPTLEQFQVYAAK